MKYFLLISLLFRLQTPALLAGDTLGCEDHPVLKHLSGSEIIWAKNAKFDELAIPLVRVEFVPVGVATAAPTASNADEAGRAKNRRVEIVTM